jgi:hypothetical protein
MLAESRLNNPLVACIIVQLAAPAAWHVCAAALVQGGFGPTGGRHPASWWDVQLCRIGTYQLLIIGVTLVTLKV